MQKRPDKVPVKSIAPLDSRMLWVGLLLRLGSFGQAALEPYNNRALVINNTKVS